jgi:hypothetical protein
MPRKSKFLSDAGISDEAIAMLRGRIRRRVMHHITRGYAPDGRSYSRDPEHWVYVKDEVQEALTTVLGEEIG